MRAIALLVVLGSIAHAGPWVPAPGHVYVELRGQLATASEGFDDGGSRRALATYTDDGRLVATRLYDAQLGLHAEIGVATHLAVLADFSPLRSVRETRPAQPARAALGVGDLLLGLRLQLIDEEVVCAIDARLGIPTAPSDGAQPLGPGDLRGEFLLSLGRAFSRVPFFVQGALGAEVRSSGSQRVPAAAITTEIDYASELVFGAQLGYLARVSERLRLSPSVVLDGRYGLRAPTGDAVVNGEVAAPLQPASTRLLRLGAALGFDVTPRPNQQSTAPIVLHLQVGGGAFVWGRGVPAAGDVIVALGLSR